MRARVAASITAGTLARHLRVRPCEVVDVEEGRRQVASELLLTWCEAIGIELGPLLARASTPASRGDRGVLVDLDTISELPANRGWHSELACWARTQSVVHESRHLMLLADDIAELAGTWEVSVTELMVVLRDFAPLARLDRDNATRFRRAGQLNASTRHERDG